MAIELFLQKKMIVFSLCERTDLAWEGDVWLITS